MCNVLVADIHLYRQICSKLRYCVPIIQDQVTPITSLHTLDASKKYLNILKPLTVAHTDLTEVRYCPAQRSLHPPLSSNSLRYEDTLSIAITSDGFGVGQKASGKQRQPV